MVYIKADIALYTNVLTEYCDVTSSLEQLWLHVQEPGRKYFVIGVAYRPPAASIKQFLEELQCSMAKIMETTGGEEHVLMGDFNMDFGHMEQNNCIKL